jgi:hypothetical protein
MLKVDMHVEELPNREVNPTKGRWIRLEKEKLIHKDVVNELQIIQEVEDKPLEMCRDLSFDLESAKSITQLRRLNKEELL